jgi:murein DD-endopeptidase MepM/ murein hydrolase activator NlpD
MAHRRHWTVLLLPSDGTTSRSIEVSHRLGAGLLWTLGILLSALVLTTGLLLSRSGGRARLTYSDTENRRLRGELDDLRAQIDTLSQSMDSVSALDDKFRTISGLKPLDAEVKEAGGGGPAGDASGDAVGLADPAVAAELTEVSSRLSFLQRLAQVMKESRLEALGKVEATASRLASTPAMTPVHGYLTSSFSRSRFHPVLHLKRPHLGVDIAATTGTPVRAPADGVVRFAGPKPGGYGHVVEVVHGHGFVTRFAHLSTVLVHRGQHIHRGDVLAEVGSTGLTTGPHLHYEVEVDGRRVDPQDFMLDDFAVP